jgi:GTP-binding protein
MTAGFKSQFPNDGLPEVALIGRSNVGKSSLINTLLQRRNLAKTSATPGKTRTVNFYKVNDAFYLVDLPGYGFVQAGLEERGRLERLINEYFRGRSQLRLVVQLLDIRHEPSKLDLAMNAGLREIPCDQMIVATKADKLGSTNQRKQLQLIAGVLGVDPGSGIMMFSSLNRSGRDELLTRIGNAIRGDGADDPEDAEPTAIP